MRILAIRGADLASLTGEFELALARSPLGDEGLIAITGPTGSGKSTLLDALCLALYGTMPRLPGGHGAALPEAGQTVAVNDPRNILRRGAGAGYAEVDFLALDGRRYRSRWSVRRARGRPDGRLQPVEMALWDLDQDRLLTAQRREHERRIGELLGLSFDQFRRSVLLAQGDFAAFLRARPGERALLLERITGTECYARLSKAAHRQAREMSEALESLHRQLGRLERLEPEARAGLEARCVRLQQEVEAAGARERQSEAALRWHQQRQALQQTLEQAEEEVRDLEARTRELAPRLQQLAQREQVAAWLPDYRAWQEACSGLQRVAGELADCSHRLALGRIRLARSARAQARARARWQQAHEALDAARPRLARMRELDAERAALKEHRARLRTEASAQQAELDARQAEAQRIELQRRQAAEEARAAAEWLQAHPQWSALSEQWPHWSDLLHRWLEAHRTLTRGACQQARAEPRRQRLDGLLRRLQQQEADNRIQLQRLQQAAEALQSERARLPHPEQLQKAQRRLQPRRDVLETALRLQQERRALEEETRHTRSRLEQARQGLNRHRTAREHIGLQLEEARHALQRLEPGAGEAAARLRAGLEPGHPCPVCGSPEHPWAGEVPEALRRALQQQRHRVVELEQALRREEQALARRQVEMETAQQALSQQQRQAEERTRALAELEAAWKRLTGEAPPALRLTDAAMAAELQQRLAALDREAQALQRQWQDQERLQQRLERNRTARDRLRLEQEDLALRLRCLAARQAALGEALARLESRIQVARREQVQAQEALVAPLEVIEDWPRRLAGEGKAFLDRLNAQVARAGECLEQQARARAREQKLVADAAVLQARIDTLSGRGKELAQALAAVEDRIEALSDERRALFEGRPVDQVEAELEQAVRQAEAILDARRRAQETAVRHRTRLEETRAQLERHREELATRRRTLQRQLARRLVTLEWSWARLETLLELPESRLAQWRRERDRLAQARAEAKARQAERLGRLQEHQAQAPSMDEPSARAELDESRRLLEQARESLQACRLALTRDDEARARAGELEQALAEHERQTRLWESLDQLIGSADGARFRRFAQSLTLEVLVEHANRHLAQLAPRYRLERIPGAEMEMRVVDADLGDAARTVYGLSGGETFLVSLALALGMASLSARRVPVGSLFIDEGFGTLDRHTLDLAVEALDALQAQGRQVTVISHVPALVEGVRAQVRVRPLGGGRSVVEGPGWQPESDRLPGGR